MPAKAASSPAGASEPMEATQARPKPKDAPERQPRPGNGHPGGRRTVGASDNPAVVNGARAKNNGRYNGNGREWATPPEVFDPLHTEFDFTLDPCATAASAKCARFFTEADDGLARSWAGERVFCNPPWWHEDVVGCAEVRYIRGRVRFLTGGPYRAIGFFASVVVVWRPGLVQRWTRARGESPCSRFEPTR